MAEICLLAFGILVVLGSVLTLPPFASFLPFLYAIFVMHWSSLPLPQGAILEPHRHVTHLGISLRQVPCWNSVVFGGEGEGRLAIAFMSFVGMA